MLIGRKSKGVEDSVYGKKLSSLIVSSLDKRFPGEPLKVLGRFMKMEFDLRASLCKKDSELRKWEDARKSLSQVTSMGFGDILDEKDLKHLKEYSKGRSPERKAIARVYKNLRDLLLFRIK